MDPMCMLGFFKQDTCPKVLLYDTRPFLAFFDSVANRRFCNGGIVLDMYGQQYGFFYGKWGSYSYQGVDSYVIYSGNFFDSPLTQLLQGVPHFCQVLGHALIFGFVFFLHIFHDKLRITIDPEFRDEKCKCEVQSEQNGFVLDFIVWCKESEPDGLLQLFASWRL